MGSERASGGGGSGGTGGFVEDEAGRRRRGRGGGSASPRSSSSPGRVPIPTSSGVSPGPKKGGGQSCLVTEGPEKRETENSK